MWWLTLTSAFAADVVWLGPHEATDEAALIATLGEQVTALEPLDLRAAATRETEADEAALTAVSSVLRDVRQYETRLDGELLIMADLEAPISSVGLLRSPEDLEVLFGALAYQGFAVDRFFASTLSEDERAAPYRTTVEGNTWVRPWADAAALAPQREMTAYEVAEAPQRIAYGTVREGVTRLLPAAISLSGLPDGSTLVVDGKTAVPDGAGTVKVPPGRHFGHVLLDGRIVARFQSRLGPTERTTWTVPLDDQTWRTWWTAAQSGTPTAAPAALAPSIEALGGSVVLARPTADGLQAWRVSGDGVEALEIAVTAPAEPELPEPTADDGEAGLFVAGAVGGGWMASGDFYLQDPANVPHEVSSVNTGLAALGLEVGWQSRWFRVAAGVDLPVTLAEYALAYTGDASTRLRAYPHVSVGLPWVQVHAGFLFPYHPAGGGRINIPIVDGLEVRASYTVGLPVTWQRDDGSEWTSQALYTAWAGIGYRL